MFARWYERFGPRYPQLLLGVALRVEYIVVALSAAALSLYVDMSWASSFC